MSELQCKERVVNTARAQHDPARAAAGRLRRARMLRSLFLSLYLYFRGPKGVTVIGYYNCSRFEYVPSKSAVGSLARYGRCSYVQLLT